MATKNKTPKQILIAPAISSLEVGQSVFFHSEKSATVKSAIQTIYRKTSWSKRFETNVDKAKKQINVTRTA